MKKRNIFIKPLAAILAVVMSVSFPAAGNAGSVASAASEEDASGSMEWNMKKEIIVKKGNCEYHAFLSADGKESWIYKLAIHKDGLKKLSFPAKVKDAPVTRIGCGEELAVEWLGMEDSEWCHTIFGGILEPWHNCYSTHSVADSITTIEFPTTLTRIDTGSFSGFKKLKKVKIPSGVKELRPYSFAACPKLTEVTLPAGLTSFNVWAFDKSKAISKITISSKSKNFKTKNGLLLSKNSKSLIWAPPVLTKVTIPEGVTKIENNALFATKATNVVIPKSVRDIGRCALSGKSIQKVELKKGNKAFKMDGNCIYKISDKSLAAIVIKKGKAKISSKVEILGEGISVMGDGIKRVDIPKSVNKVIEDWMFFGNYIKVYFHGTKPPQIVSEVPGYVFTALPIFNEVYVPKEAKEAYIKWADDRDGLKWDKLKTF